MILRILGSSSSGNCYLLENETECLMIECGIPIKEVKKNILLDCGDCRLQSAISHHSGNHGVDFGICNGIGDSVGTAGGGYAEGLEGLSQAAVALGVGNNRHFGSIFYRLLNEQIHTCIGSEKNSAESVGILRNNVESLSSDRACTAENCYIFHEFIIFNNQNANLLQISQKSHTTRHN